MRIGIFSPNFGGPGTGADARNLSAALAARGHGVQAVPDSMKAEALRRLKLDVVIGQHRGIGVASSLARSIGAKFVRLVHPPERVRSGEVQADLVAVAYKHQIDVTRAVVGETPVVAFNPDPSEFCDAVIALVNPPAKPIADFYAVPVTTPIVSRRMSEAMATVSGVVQPVQVPTMTMPRIETTHTFPGAVRFKIVVPCYNAARWVRDCLESIRVQRYDNFECVVYDDASTDDTSKIIASMKLDNRFRVVRNDRNVGPLTNCWNGFDLLGCREDPGAVLMILDGDDWLAGPGALDTIRAAYERRPELLFTWGNSAFGSAAAGGRGGATPADVIATRAFRRDHTFVCHPRTFRSRLWCALRRRDLVDPRTGDMLRVGGDVGFIIPMLEMAGNRIEFIRDIVHVYNTNNPISDFRVHKDDQRRVNEHIRSLLPYPLLESIEQPRPVYRSQYGQDRFILEEVFAGKSGGVFVDIGAYDGVKFSNTCVLERHHGWTGLCVEPLPHVFDRLRRARSCTCVRAAVGTSSGERNLTWVEGDSEMLSGLSDAYVDPHRNRIARETAANGGSQRAMRVPCRRLDELLAEHGIRRVDYLSIDVEGAELEVLGSIDLARAGVECLTVENNYGDERIGSFLGERGYGRVAILGCDEVYRRRRG